MPGAIGLFIGGSSDGAASISLTFPLPGQFLVACVDYDGIVLPGNDTTAAMGVATTFAAALALAKTTPFKTLERLGQVLPRSGNDSTCQIFIRPRTAGANYLKIDGVTTQTADWRNQINGYKRLGIMGSNDFTRSTTDKIGCGFQTVPTTSATGYNATAGATASTLPCQIAGGGAAGLPLEVAVSGSTITGKRIRFSATTVTVALQNACSNVWLNDANQIVVGINLPAVPVTGNAGDVFFIEEPAIGYGSCAQKLGDNDQISIGGERYSATGTIAINMGTCSFSGCEGSAGVSFIRGEFLTLQTNLFDETGTFFNVGTAGRWGGTLSIADIRRSGFSGGASVGNGGLTGFGLGRFGSMGIGCFAGAGFQDTTYSGEVCAGNAATQAQRTWGNAGNAGFQRLRVTGVGGLAAGAVLAAGGGNLRGIDISGQGARACIMVGSTNQNNNQVWAIDDVVSTAGGNTDVVLSLVALQTQNSTIRIGSLAANTITATLGDMRIGGAIIASFAQLATSNLWDVNGNNIIGSALGLTMSEPGKSFVNSSGGTIPLYSIVRSNGVSGQMTTAQANTAANAAGIIGVCMTAPLNGASGLVATPGSSCPIQFDASLPVAGGIAYLSVGTTGDAQSGIPPVAATNQKNRLGIVGSLAGSIGFVAFSPDKLAVLADGAA